MSQIIFIYFEGCPNADRVRNSLREINKEFTEIRQDDLPAKHPFTNYTSPTILRGEEIIFGNATDSAGGCSLQIPTTAEILRRLGN